MRKNGVRVEVEDNHQHGNFSATSIFLRGLLSLLLLIVALLLEHLFTPVWFTEWLKPLPYLLAYLPVGLPVIKEAIESLFSGELFSEFLLMTIATIGAFAIGEYPEAVAVMLFYTVGEGFQTLALNRARGSIEALIDERPDFVTLLKEDERVVIAAQEVDVEERVELKPGEKVALDGILISQEAFFDTSSLTGESAPSTKRAGEVVLAGMINLNRVAVVEVTTPYNQSKLSEILQLIEQASQRKAPTELFIRKFAKYYTPFVIFAALAIVLIPLLFVANYNFSEWLYRALIFLVISCPCALVISIPLGYFGGIGAAGKKGVLFKGGNYLDALAEIQHIAFDKTGTLTTGQFTVKEIVINNYLSEEGEVVPTTERVLSMVRSVESFSTHPIAQAILSSPHFKGLEEQIEVKDFQEVTGEGAIGVIDGVELIVGNSKIMQRFGVEHSVAPLKIAESSILVAYNGQYLGYIIVADQIREEAYSTIESLKRLGIKTSLLSGDKSLVVESVAKSVGIEESYGDLLPQDKVAKIEEIKQRGERVAFVGDGVNDSPVIAFSDVGIAMGGLGSDAAVEIADVVIQDDNLHRIVTSIEIGKATKRVVWQNIILAFVVKGLVLALGAGGIATMWEAVFADVGVALLAILNAARVQRVRLTGQVSG